MLTIYATDSAKLQYKFQLTTQKDEATGKFKLKTNATIKARGQWLKPALSTGFGDPMFDSAEQATDDFKSKMPARGYTITKEVES